MQPPDRSTFTDPAPSESAPVELGAALRALPQEQPDTDGWMQLSRSLSAECAGMERTRRSRRRTRMWLAAAAVMALAVVLPARWPTPTTGTDAGTVATTATVAPSATIDATSALQRIAQLHRESAELEALLTVARDDVVISSTGDSLRDAITERVQFVDALITDPQTDPSTQLPLWQERVLLLRRLVAVEGGERLLALNGEAESSQLVMAF